MTNQEYLTKSLGGLNLSQDDIEIIMLKAGITGSAEADAKACDRAVYDRFSVVLKAVTQNVTEGGYSVSWNLEAVKDYYKSLCGELGLENRVFSRPRVRSRSNIW